MMVMIDTCQANTLYASIYSPNVLATGSSALGENSYSHHNDMDIGVAVIDSFTHHVLQYLERVGRGSNATMREFVGPPTLAFCITDRISLGFAQFDIYDPEKIKSHPGIRTDLFPHDLSQTLVTDFFGGVAQVEMPSHSASNDSVPWPAASSQPPVTVDDVSAHQNTSTVASPTYGQDLRATIRPPTQDWLVVALLVGCLWILQRWTGARTGWRKEKGKGKLE
jgi:glycosylphosphatidylinositol transamidase (GPIT) subunit GPI8